MSKLKARKGVLTLTHAMEAIVRGLYVGQVPMLLGQSGAGKSAVIESLTKVIPNSVMIPITLVSKEAYDFAGIPDSEEWKDDDGKVFDKRMTFLKPGMIPLEGDELNTELIPKGTNVIIIFIDEVPEGDEQTLKALYRIINERMVDDRKVHPLVRFVCAGNRTEDGANTKQLLPPFANRMFHITVELSTSEWVTWAAKNKVLPEIRAFIASNPEYLHTYKADSESQGGCKEAWGSPRSWTNLNKYLQGNSAVAALDITDEDDWVAQAAPASFVGELAGQQFIDYTTSTKLAPIADILADQLYDVNVLTAGELFLLGQSLISVADTNNIADVLRIMDMMPADHKVICYSALTSLPADVYMSVIKNPGFKEFAKNNKSLMMVLHKTS